MGLYRSWRGGADGPFAEPSCWTPSPAHQIGPLAVPTPRWLGSHRSVNDKPVCEQGAASEPPPRRLKLMALTPA